jgi:glycosyltransferase involved in cell wall biosynthesis
VRPPRVLHACDFFLKYASGLAGGLEGLGCPEMLVTRDHDFEFGGEPGAARARVASDAGGRIRHVEIEGRLRDPGGLRSLGRAVRARRAFAPDVVHLQDSVGDDPRLVVASGVPFDRLAVTTHDVAQHPGDPIAARWKLRFEDELTRRARIVFVHAEALRDALIERLAPRGAVVVVPHGIDAPDPQPLPAQPSLLFFGRMSHYKGLDTLLDAMPLVWERFPGLGLVVMGAGPVEEHPALADPRVTLRNEHVPERELAEVFGAATCAVLPYREASQSGVGSVAKRFGRASVVTAVGGLPELVADGSGVVVAPEDPAALAGALIELVGDPARAEEMGRIAARTVAETAGWPRVAELTLEAYERHILRSAGLRGPTPASGRGA